MLFHRKKFYIFSATLVLLSLISILVWGLNFSIDFTGGSLMEIRYLTSRPPMEEIRWLAENTIGKEFIVQPLGEKSYLLRFRSVNDKEHLRILEELKKLGDLEEDRFATVGSIIGKELRNKSLWAILAVSVIMVLFIAWSFRKVSQQISSFKYGLAAIIALIHDVSITIGVFAVLGWFFNVEIDVPFVAAILTIMGYSVNDTIIIFDRIRSNIIAKGFDSFESLVEVSVRSALVRSLNTSLTTLFVLAAIFLFGGETIKFFALALIVGIAFGTYSSIFIAGAILVDWQKRK